MQTMCIYEGNPPNVYFRAGETMGKTDIRRVEFPVYARCKKFGFTLPGTPKKFSLGSFPTLTCAVCARDFSVYILDGIFNSMNSQKQYFTSYFQDYLHQWHPTQFNLASFFGISQDEAKRFCVKILKMSVYWTGLSAKNKSLLEFVNSSPSDIVKYTNGRLCRSIEAVKQYTLGKKLDSSRLLEFSYFSGFCDDSLVSKWGEPVISDSIPSKPEALLWCRRDPEVFYRAA